MILKKIVLKNYRNYSEQEFFFNDKFNFIYGNNGHGKTNILEAVSYAAFGKSFLGSAESDCVKFGEDEFFIESGFENDLENKDKIVVSYNLSTKTKSIHKNKEKVSAFSSEIFGRFPIVFLSPKSLNITQGNPSERRKFFDILISQSSRLYLDYLKELAKILKQKNALLKNYTVHRKYSDSEFRNLINSYNEKLIDVSSNIIFKRLNFLTEFESFFKRSFSMLNVQDHEASISYFSEALGETDPEGKNPDLNFVRKKTEESIYSKTGEEIKRAVSLAGPHRDDYIFKLQKNETENNSPFELKNFASQGEHKTFLVALKLSEYDYLKDKKFTSPVLLLDDVLSELDESRVSSIISHLKDYGQIFLTTTDKSYSENLKEFYTPKEISVFEIELGKLLN
ncbi:MAG: DNA replication/repair protein RecF [Ignavibacteria bacterium]|nr:DNA replication/repair protein RecF [Ignavibacteria bacterium]